MGIFFVLLRTLGDEKSLLYESLCEQTEKLEACRNQLESTRQLLLQKVKRLCLNSKICYVTLKFLFQLSCPNGQWLTLGISLYLLVWNGHTGRLSTIYFNQEDSPMMDNPEREKKLLDVLKSAQVKCPQLSCRTNWYEEHGTCTMMCAHSVTVTDWLIRHYCDSYAIFMGVWEMRINEDEFTNIRPQLCSESSDSVTIILSLWLIQDERDRLDQKAKSLSTLVEDLRAGKLSK